MSLFSWFLEDKKEQDTSPKFVPRINVSNKSTLHVEVEPKDPTNNSNIVITAFASPNVRSIVPIRVDWTRYKIKTPTNHTEEKIHCLVGNTYMCEPADVGAYIKAIVKSVDDSVRGEAEVVVGPIGIDVMMKRLIEGAMYSGSLLSQVKVCEKDRKNEVSLRLNTRTMEFTDENSGEKLVKEYSMSEPKLQLNPKDSTRVYLRFEQDQTNSVREWLNSIYNIRNASVDESSMSIKVPYGQNSSSKLRLFQKEDSHCVNKMELRFISRSSRDLFLFTQRAFICREDMKNNIFLQRIETMQTLNTEQDYHHFLAYLSLKNEIIRLADVAKELQDDRNAKVKDLIAMEESIGDMTLTYLKIIEEKGKNQHVDFEQSYSQISMTREEILNRKHLRELKNENEALKGRVREMNEEIQLLKFFKKEENESMIFNQTSNPFAKKNPHDLSVSYQVAVSPEDGKAQRKNMYEMSINYTKLLEENNELKRQVMTNRKADRLNPHEKSRNMIEILGDLEEKEESEVRHMNYQKKIASLETENQELKKKVEELNALNTSQARRGLNVTTSNKSFTILSNQSNQSIVSTSSVADSFINQSITSQAAIVQLQKNLESLSKLNTKLQQDNTRLRREREYYRSEATKLNNQIKEIEARVPTQERSHIAALMDNSMVARVQEENESLQNEKKSLMRKLESLSRENASGIRQEFVQKERKLKEYEQLIDKLKQENITLSRSQEENKEAFADLELFKSENTKLRKINSELLEQIKTLKIELEINKDNLYNSRIIEMENQLKAVKSDPSNNQLSSENRELLHKVNELTKANTKLKQENQDKQTKLNHQAVTIEKLMLESQKLETSTIHKKHNSSTHSTKEKAYSEKCSQGTVEEVEKYKREIKKLQEEIIFMKKSSDALNRSRDLTLEMDSYNEEMVQGMRREVKILTYENQNIGRMCERYRKDALEAKKEIQKINKQLRELKALKLQQSSFLNLQ